MIRAAPCARAAVLCALAAACIAGCGGGGGPSTSTTTAALAHSFVDLVPAVPLNLDETGTPDDASSQILPSWASELVRPRPAAPGPDARLPADDAVVPYLATSWTRSATGSYTFTLRRGVRGVSGDPFTAADVRWSLQRAAARSPVAPFLFALAHIDSADPATVLGPHTVRVNVTSPSPFTLTALASYDAAIYDAALYRSHATRADPWAQAWGTRHSASFGAYWVAYFDPGREIVLNENPGFWRRPYFGRVYIRGVANPSTRLNAVLDGSATHTSGLTWQEFQEAVNTATENGVRATILQTGPGVIAWHLNVASGPLANPQVRQALNLGIDRAALADAIDGSFATASSSVLPAAFGQTQPSNFDPPQGRSLLRAAGYPPGTLTIDIYVNDGELSGDAPAILGYLYHDMQELGVNLKMTYVDNIDELLAMEEHGQVESTIDAVTPLTGGAGFLLEETADTSGDPVSVAADERYSNSTLQGLLAQLRSSSGGTATQSLIQQAAQIIDADVPTVNIAAIPVQNVTRANITGYAAYTRPVVYYEDLRPARG